MDINEIFLTLKRNAIFIVIFAIIGGFIGLSSSSIFSSGYQHSGTFFLTEPAVKNNIEDIRSDNFLQQEKARNFTDTAIAILQSADFQRNAVLPGDSLNVRKKAPQVISLVYSSSNIDEKNSNIFNLVSEFNSIVANLTESTPASQLKPIGQLGNPLYSSTGKSTLVFAGSLIGVIFAILILSTKNYLKL